MSNPGDWFWHLRDQVYLPSRMPDFTRLWKQQDQVDSSTTPVEDDRTFWQRMEPHLVRLQVRWWLLLLLLFLLLLLLFLLLLVLFLLLLLLLCPCRGCYSQKLLLLLLMLLFLLLNLLLFLLFSC